MDVEQIAVGLMIFASILAGLELYSRHIRLDVRPLSTGSIMVIFILSVAFSVYVFVW